MGVSRTNFWGSRSGEYTAGERGGVLGHTFHHLHKNEPDLPTPRGMEEQYKVRGGRTLGQILAADGVEKGRGGMLGVIVCEVHTERR